jgi:stearoyl-CoA desaturase (Delta-9 desaturase)
MWRVVNLAYFTTLHLLCLAGLPTLLTLPLSGWVTLGCWFFASCLGVTAGAHRLWAHKSYHATPSLQFLLLGLQSSAIQMPVLSWARIHRAHHRHVDTEQDPHNIHRGFWFAHVAIATQGQRARLSRRGGRE